MKTNSVLLQTTAFKDTAWSVIGSMKNGTDQRDVEERVSDDKMFETDTRKFIGGITS